MDKKKEYHAKSCRIAKNGCKIGCKFRATPNMIFSVNLTENIKKS